MSARELSPSHDGLLTWDYISGIHGILVLNETEAIHELDLGYFAGSMGSEVSLDIGLGSYRKSSSQRLHRFQVVLRLWRAWFRGSFPRGWRSLDGSLRTSAREIPQVEAGGRHLGHDGQALIRISWSK